MSAIFVEVNENKQKNRCQTTTISLIGYVNYSATIASTGQLEAQAPQSAQTSGLIT